MKLSVIVPVYNEQATVAAMLKKLFKLKQVSEVIVVDDGSTDETLELVNKLTGKRIKGKKIKILHKKNGGKGSAVRLGLQKVTGDYVLIQDADLEYDPEDIPSLIDPITKGKAQVVYGSRFLGPHLNLLYWHLVGNRLINFVTNILYNTTLSDLETCYKLLPTELLRELDVPYSSFDLEPEITCKVLKRGIKIYEVPISYVGRDFSQGKKITWQDGLQAIWVIIKLRFTL